MKHLIINLKAGDPIEISIDTTCRYDITYQGKSTIINITNSVFANSGIAEYKLKNVWVYLRDIECANITSVKLINDADVQIYESDTECDTVRFSISDATIINTDEGVKPGILESLRFVFTS